MEKDPFATITERVALPYRFKLSILEPNSKPELLTVLGGEQ